MELGIGSLVWVPDGEDHWWPSVIVEPAEPLTGDDTRFVYFFGTGDGAEVSLSTILPLQADDNDEKMNDPVTASAVAALRQHLAESAVQDEDERVEEKDAGKSERSKRDKEARAQRKAEKAARREQRREQRRHEAPTDGDADDETREAQEPEVLPFETMDYHDDEPAERLHEIRRTQPKASRQQTRGITAVEVAMTAPVKQLKQSLGYCREKYRGKVSQIDSASSVSSLHESDFIQMIDRRLCFQSLLKRSLTELLDKTNESDASEEAAINEELKRIEDISPEDCINQIADEMVVGRPAEKPERKKGPRYGFTDPFLAHDWNQKLEVHIMRPNDSAGLDLSAPMNRQSSRRETKVSVMKNWLAIRDLSAAYRPKDTQPVPAEGATARRFDSISKKILARSHHASVISRHSASGTDWEQQPPLQSYFQFSDFAGNTVAVRSEVDSVPSMHNYLTPVNADIAFLAASSAEEQSDELPEDLVQPQGGDVQVLPTPSQAWSVASELRSAHDDDAVKPRDTSQASVSNDDWIKKAKKVVAYQLSKFFHGKGGKSKLIHSTNQFAELGESILQRVVKGKSENEHKSLALNENAALEFTDLDEQKIKKEVDKCMAAVTLPRKAVSGRHSAASRSNAGGDRKRLRGGEY